MLVDSTSGVERRFTISLRAALLTTGAVLLLPILIGLGARGSARAAIEELVRANILLQVENSSYKDATGELASQISALQATVDEIGAQAEVDPAAGRAMDKLPAVVKSRAMGGVSAADLTPVFGAAFGAPDSAFNVLRDLLRIMENRLDRVRNGVERRQALASATPSIWPVPGWLTSRFGSRLDPFTGNTDFHPGLDISADAGQAVRATADGTVETATATGGYGNMVVLDHGYGITTRYGHLSRFGVSAGQLVRRGEVIGYVGSTGRSTSPHLHYEILVNGQLTDPMRLLSTR